MKEKIILHIDMDYFFAQIEERENPQFKGKPVVVGADPKKGKGRGVVSTCNYKARKFGIKSGMPISRAYKLCPEAVFLPVNMKFYQEVSLSIFKIVLKKTKKIERVSLHEAYVDLTEEAGSYKKAKKIGREIKEKVFKKEKLTCTVGIGKNKMMAKIACEAAKPNGIKVVYPKESAKFISEMEVEKIPGIGPKTKKEIEKNLKKEDPKIKDALSFSKDKLIDLFGKRGKDFYDKFRGEDYSVVEYKKKAKSIGKEHTFQKDTNNSEEIIKVFKKLVKDVYKQLKSRRVKGITVVCRYEDFETHTKQVTFNDEIEKREDFFYKKGVSLLLKFLTQSNKKVRLVGFRVKIK